MTQLEEKAEDIIAKFVEEINPINLKTGKQYTPSLEQFQSAWAKAVQSIVALSKGLIK